MIVDRRFRGEAVRTSETSVDNHFTRQYNPEDNSEHHTRRRENLKSHMAQLSASYLDLYFEAILIPVSRPLLGKSFV
jgi:hypothetical protein